jgi:tagaturonate reductase
MQLSKQTISKIEKQSGLTIPDEKVLELPEKVLQFGTGVLLRGLPDYFIDKANRQGLFNGRVVVVKSTSSGGTDAFQQQDGLFTLVVRGIENGSEVAETIINSSISRVLSAKEEWKQILQCAYNKEMQIIISNTTEVGIQMADDNVLTDETPPSYPGKLLAFLYERFKAFNGSAESGMVIVPTELIVDNGKKLQSIVVAMAEKNGLSAEFIQWLTQHNEFCSSLVDRIVPGKMAAAEQAALENKLGYTDELMIMSECFRLWAIESGSEKVKNILSFAAADEGVVIAADIEKFRELKNRLLNCTHTFSCGLANLAGFVTVKEAMQDTKFYSFVRDLAINEIATTISSDIISYEEATAFAEKVLDRFKNPFLEHKWLSIAVQFTSKMKMRNIPLLVKHYSKNNEVPAGMALGFAAYLVFIRKVIEAKIPVQDDNLAYIMENWLSEDSNTFVQKAISDETFWGVSLAALDGFAAAVRANVDQLQSEGAILLS